MTDLPKPRRLEDAWEAMSEDTTLSGGAKEYVRSAFFAGACAVLDQLNRASREGDVDNFLLVRDELYFEANQFKKEITDLE